MKMIAITLRESHSADWNGWAACLNDGENFFGVLRSMRFAISSTVSGGDSFAGGLIYGLNTYENKQQALEFTRVRFPLEALPSSATSTELAFLTWRS